MPAQSAETAVLKNICSTTQKGSFALREKTSGANAIVNKSSMSNPFFNRLFSSKQGSLTGRHCEPPTIHIYDESAARQSRFSSGIIDFGF
jgi:hypothetical protein